MPPRLPTNPLEISEKNSSRTPVSDANVMPAFEIFSYFQYVLNTVVKIQISIANFIDFLNNICIFENLT